VWAFTRMQMISRYTLVWELIEQFNLCRIALALCQNGVWTMICYLIHLSPRQCRLVLNLFLLNRAAEKDIRVAGNNIALSDKVKIVGLTFDQDLSHFSYYRI
jgi:hypothetical protein